MNRTVNLNKDLYVYFGCFVSTSLNEDSDLRASPVVSSIRPMDLSDRGSTTSPQRHHNVTTTSPQRHHIMEK